MSTIHVVGNEALLVLTGLDALVSTDTEITIVNNAPALDISTGARLARVLDVLCSRTAPEDLQRHRVGAPRCPP